MNFLFFSASIYRDLKAAGYKYLIEERQLTRNELQTDFTFPQERAFIELVPSRVAPANMPVNYYEIESNEAFLAAKGALNASYFLKANAYVL